LKNSTQHLTLDIYYIDAEATSDDIQKMTITANYKTQLQRLSLSLILLSILIIAFLLSGQYIALSVSIIAVMAVGRIWYRILGEDLIIYTLKRNSGSMHYEAILKQYPKNGRSTLHRLVQKGIVTIEGDCVILIDTSSICSFCNR
jgi:hypothetical protein